MTSLHVICGLGPSVKSPGYAYSLNCLLRLGIEPKSSIHVADSLPTSVISQYVFCFPTHKFL